ncbi:MAG: hypothetical protein O2958_12170 [Gemmatimonadetes bacterium]|nr:hypothetical protein [Gemmatimonadota bacterium]MDA1103016.1 hypothetical protein [Gemmatimonadota bacterium]
MASKRSIWFHLGHAFERARLGTPPKRSIAALAERGRSERGPTRRDRHDVEARAGLPSADDLMAAGIAMLVDRALAGWGKRSEPGFTRLARAGMAGAAAALVVDLVRPLLRGQAELPVIDRETASRLVAGVGQGLVYASIVEPRVPGPAAVKGALYGSAEYAMDPMGGLAGLLGSHTPHGGLPVIGAVVDGLDRHDRAYLEHVVFGIALALIYESSVSSKGILPDGV